MKDNLESAAKKCADSFLFTAFYTESEIKTALIEAFEAGAKWQKTQKLDLHKLWKQSIQLDGLHTFDEAPAACPPGYRVPTGEEQEWLIDNTEYSFDKETREGVFTFPDGAELRLPAAGYRYGNGDSHYQGTCGSYWSSSPSGTLALYVYFDGSTADVDTYDRVYAFSVRCVPIEIK